MLDSWSLAGARRHGPGGDLVVEGTSSNGVRSHRLGAVSSSRRPIGALVLAGSLLASPASARPSAPPLEELKLVLVPEADQSPPQRVCLVSRSHAMAEARGAFGVTALADGLRCAGSTCTTDRGAPPARCSICPESTHSGCAATLDLGRWPADAYSVVCADDDTRPADGGTVYLSVEAVEAENPPTFYTIEVSGGRVRWSAIDALSRPSYRVLGGDFEPSPVSYPRESTDAAWIDVPVRRRCRCLDTRLAGVSKTLDVRIDDEPVCRGRPTSQALLPVEVPATGDGRLRVLSVAVDGADYTSRWSSRWPSLPIDATIERLGVRWSKPCMWPRPDACPRFTIRGAECAMHGLDDGQCAYDCAVVTEGAVTLPLTARVSLAEPELAFDATIDGVGQVVAGQVPADGRYLSIDVAGWQAGVAGDRIRSVELSTGDGRGATALVDPEAGGVAPIPLSGARCGQVLRARLVGERDYRPAVAPIVAGGRLDLPPPEDLAVGWDLIYGIGGGPMAIVSPGAPASRRVATSVAAVGTLGLRWRAPGARWFVQPQAAAMFLRGWPATRMTLDGPAPVDESIAAVGAEVLGGWSDRWGEQTVHLTAGGGALAIVEGLAGDPGLIDGERPVATAVLGLSTAILEGAGRRAVVGLDARYGFVARTVHLVADATDDPLPSAIIPHERRLTPAHVALLSIWLGVRD